MGINEERTRERIITKSEHKLYRKHQRRETGGEAGIKTKGRFENKNLKKRQQRVIQHRLTRDSHQPLKHKEKVS